MEQFEKIKEIVAAVEADVTKFESSNASAGSRVRKSMQEIKKLCQEVRVAVQEKKNADKAAK